jgi:DNA-binding FadR family transcriptional regulator
VNPRYDFLEISQNNIGNFDLTILDFEAYEIFESRVLIETALARIAAKHATKPDILKMKNTLLKNKLAISKSQKFYETDVQFHSLLYEIPKNSIFPLIHNIYINWLFKYWELMPENIEINKKNYNDHKNIFEAIIDRDPDQAEALTEAHLKTAWQYVKLVF